jgi:hypothetical protein
MNTNPENTEVELDGVDELEIEIIDDTPEKDRARPRLPDGETPEIPADDDIAQYSEGVQKRIKKLTFAANEERRQKEEASRLRDEAIAFAQAQRQEAETLRAKLQQGDAALISQAQQRLQSQLAQTQAKMKMAYEAGDADAFVAANSELAGLKAEESRLSSYRPPQRAAQPAPVAPPQQAPRVAPPSTKAQMWAADNEWFGKDEEMTALAFGVHERVIRQGVAPDSDAYYSAINSAVRQRFPDKFAAPQESAPARKPSSVVAPGGRSSATAPRKITLTATQVALAKRLGLTNEQYAAQLIKEQKNG